MLRGTDVHKTPTNSSKQEEEYLRRPSVKIFMPETLKAVLVDDWEKVTREHRLVPLPSKAPASQFLDNYAADEIRNRRPGSAESDILEEVVAGVKEYFNKSLGRILLYRQERPQYQEIYPQLVKATGELSGKSIADVYGVEHLCRLFGMSQIVLPLKHTRTDVCSIHAGSHRAHEHGLASCEPSTRGASQDDNLAQQAYARILVG